MSDVIPLLRYIGPLVLFLCFVPSLVARFKRRDDPILAKLNKQLDSELYHLNSEVEIRTKEQSVGIKYIITSKFGIFVIDVRPFVGIVDGQPNHVMWTSKTLGKIHRFSNPLNHNKEAVSVLRSRYDYESNVYHSLVIFKGKGKFAGTMPNNVRMQNNFIEYILSKETELLPDNDVHLVHKQIRDGRIPNTLKTYSQYLERAKELVSEYSVRDKGEAPLDGKTKVASTRNKSERKKVLKAKKSGGRKQIFGRKKKIAVKKKARPKKDGRLARGTKKKSVKKMRLRRSA